MHIVADENIPLLDAFFAGLGTIRRLPGRAIDRAAVADADILLVRSVTPVDRALLDGSPVRFVGTCTIGTDHLDLDYFAEAGIQWASAPGCNARGVVDYVLGSLLTLAEIEGVELPQRTYGVVGAGQVGGRLIKVLRGLGWNVLVCDPPRQQVEGGDYVSLDEIIQRCDVISLHTPLDRAGAHPSWHLFDRPHLERLRPGTWLINASRGAVVDNQALYEVMLDREDLQAVLDVWEGEPQVMCRWPSCAPWRPRTLPATASTAASAARRRSTRRCAPLCNSRPASSCRTCCRATGWRTSAWTARPTRPGPWPCCAEASTTRAVTMPTFAAPWKVTPTASARRSTPCANTTRRAAKSMH